MYKDYKNVLLMSAVLSTVSACALSPTSYCSDYQQNTRLKCSGDTAEQALATLSKFAGERCKQGFTLGEYDVTAVPRETQAYVNNSWVDIGGTYYRVSAPYACDENDE